MELTASQQQLVDRLVYDPMIFGSGGFSLKTWKALNRKRLLATGYYPQSGCLTKEYADLSAWVTFSVYANIEDIKLINPIELVAEDFINLEHAIAYAKDLQNRVIDNDKRLNYWHQKITYAVACKLTY